MEPTLNWLTDPTVFRINRLDAHSDHVCYASAQELTQGETSLRQSLDGLWRFSWSKTPAQRPAGFWQEDFDDSSFGTIPVPSHMETQGFGQIQYTNAIYPWDGHAELTPPEIDWEDTPVGSYVRTFDLSQGLLGKDVCISFQGVEQAFYVWLNGHFVGYSEDSFTPSEFRLTPYLRDTGNRLCVEVYKHSSGGWLEDQDFFRFSGIFRSVYLYAKPRLHLEDLWLQAGLEADNTTGTLSIRLKLEGETQGATVSCKVTSPEGNALFDGSLRLAQEGAYLRSQSFRFSRIRPWNHETPVLYHVLLTLKTVDGTVTGFVPYEIGFRRFEMKDKIMCLNGERIVFRGVNRHEWNPETGRAIGQKDMDAAMDTILRSGINAVRTCHYPNQTSWYHMCDQNGIYMIDETNMETHGTWQRGERGNEIPILPGSLPQWKDAVLDRAKSMFERDKNHAAILLWSCGNESHADENILAMADWFRSQDPGRLVHYVTCYNREFDHISDMESQMYTPPADVRTYLEGNPRKPFILCEYMHDMGNSIGGMESYIRLEEEFPMYQGGFIWDYMDQALWHTNCNGQRVLGYGGDFGEFPTEYAFSANGIVFADGTEKPAMQEVRYWFSSPEKRKKQDEENRKAALAAPSLPHRKAAAPLHVTHGDGALGVRGTDFEILFSYRDGGPASLTVHGKQWLWRAPRPAYWRAPTENDMGNKFAWSSAIWSAVDRWQQCDDIQILEDREEAVSIRFVHTSPAMPGLHTEVIYTVENTGVITVAVHYHGAKNRPGLPLLGLRFATPEPIEKTDWLGLSGETYPDRKKGGIFGWHREVPHIPDYLVPQECGCHMDTKAVRFHGKTGEILSLEQTDAPFAFSAIPYTPHQLSEAEHREELPAPVRTVVTVCGAMRGVGGIDTWYTDVEEPYRIDAEKDISFSFRFCL